MGILSFDHPPWGCYFSLLSWHYLFMGRTAKLALSSYIPMEDMMLLRQSFLQSTIYLLDLPGNILHHVLVPLFLFCIPEHISCTKNKTVQTSGFMACLSVRHQYSLISTIHAPAVYVPVYHAKIFRALYHNRSRHVVFCPVIMGIALLPIPAGIFSKFVILFWLYSIRWFFGIVRYIVFLFIIAKLSYLFMPVLYFSLVPW